MKRPKKKRQKAQADHLTAGRSFLNRVLRFARSEFPGLRRRGPRAPWKVELGWVGLKEMSELNSRYRGKLGPTDVLSFPTPSPFCEQGQLGEIVICLPTLKRQAREARHSETAELRILIVHGVLHLLGFDHERSKGEARIMARWEGKLLLATAASLRRRKWPIQGLIRRNA